MMNHTPKDNDSNLSKRTEMSSLLFVGNNQRDPCYSSFPESWTPESNSLRRRVFLALTEPNTSICSAVFFFILMFAIALSNVIMIMQTMDVFQFVPTDCVSCGGDVSYMFEDDIFIETEPPGVDCVCPPSPVPWTVHTLDWLVYFLTFEWCLRVAVFPDGMIQWFQFIADYTTMLDALSIFPYYLEKLPNGFVSLRIFRILRIFQLVRLGQYNQAFTSLTNVMTRSTQYLKLLVIVLAFGAAFFGSMVYWMEKGTWKYYEESGEYMFIRVGLDGQTEEPTPFDSIPKAFWWFLVTATTVGYGVRDVHLIPIIAMQFLRSNLFNKILLLAKDMYPTSTGGRYVAVLSMMMGVLVIAFPVSVFSELWAEELSGAKDREDLTNMRIEDVKMVREKEDCGEHKIPLLDAKDVQDIFDCLDEIRQREDRIRALLRRSKISCKISM